MAKTIFDRERRAELTERLSRLTPESQRRWGKMTAPQMICHLMDSLEVAIGEKPAKPRNNGMDNAFMRWLVIYVMPWPKGKARTSPEMLTTQPSEWESDIYRLRALLERACTLGRNGNWARHPAFGQLHGDQYGCLIYKHFNHHLTQFGV